MRHPSVALLMLALTSCAATRMVESSPPPETRLAADAETIARLRSLGRDGDWLVIRGYHLSDHFVATVTNNPFSHAAVIRPVWSSAASGPAALAKARSLVGRQYDFLGLIGVDVPDRYYCSELTLEVYRPYLRAEDVLPRPIEPGKLHFWGRVLYDSGAKSGQ